MKLKDGHKLHKDKRGKDRGTSEAKDPVTPQKKLLTFTRSKKPKGKLPDAKQTTGPDLEDFRDLIEDDIDDDKEMAQDDGEPDSAHAHKRNPFIQMWSALSGIPYQHAKRSPIQSCKESKDAGKRKQNWFRRWLGPWQHFWPTDMSDADRLLGAGFPRRSKSYTQSRTLSKYQSAQGERPDKATSRRTTETQESQTPMLLPKDSGNKCHLHVSLSQKCFQDMNSLQQKAKACSKAQATFHTLQQEMVMIAAFRVLMTLFPHQMRSIAWHVELTAIAMGSSLPSTKATSDWIQWHVKVSTMAMRSSLDCTKATLAELSTEGLIQESARPMSEKQRSLCHVFWLQDLA